MFARQCSTWARLGIVAATLFCAAQIAHAGHEVPYYPSFYPQEIRIEPLDPQAAAREFASITDPLHAYLGSAPRFPGAVPADLKSVVSLRSFITANVNPQSTLLYGQGRAGRCTGVVGAVAGLKLPGDIVVHRYPVTPYHADYLAHIDRVPALAPDVPHQALTYRAAVVGTAPLLGSDVPTDPVAWDLSIDEVPVDELSHAIGAGPSVWMASPFAKEGWYQAYHLLRKAMRDSDAGRRVDAIYQRLTGGESADAAARVNAERELIAALTRDCERVVIGYRLRREFYSDDFSNGIENIAVDSQLGFNSPVVMRTLKLKDLPWNGWLRLGIDTRPTAAWNPVAGFGDAAGRLVWSMVGDNAYLPIPYNSLLVPNRVEVRPHDQPTARQSIRIPADALVADDMAGGLRPAQAGDVAMAKLRYRVQASAFHDGTEMEVADLVYPYALAQRWGRQNANAETFDPGIALATQELRQRFRAVQVVGIEETKLPIADLTFTYRSPIVEVYLNDPLPDERQNAIIAPPWSSVPWHVLALMEAAVERGIAAFSQAEAQRLKRPWLDLVRDAGQQEKLRALIKKFAQTGYRPAALERLVTPDAAKARWHALDKFAETAGHLLVTNGPYKLRSVTSEVVTLDVIREFTYPIGIGTFDFYAYPAKALITRLEHIGGRILVTADAEIALKQQRDHRIVTMPFQRDTLRGTLPIRPVARYTVVAADGKVAAAGFASREPDGRFAALLPALPAGRYRFFTAIYLDGNAFDPNLGQIEFQVN